MFVKRLVLFLIHVYRIAAPELKVLFGLQSSCRYSPSCSEYTESAIKRSGTLKGLWEGARRILRCTPFHKGGIDFYPVRSPLACHGDETSLNSLASKQGFGASNGVYRAGPILGTFPDNRFHKEDR